MAKTLFIVGFSVVMGVWNVWSYRHKGGPWLWSGIALLIFAAVVAILEFGFKITVFPR